MSGNSGNKVILKIKPRNNINMQVLPPSLSLTDVERAENAANIAMAWAQDDESPNCENDTDSPTGKTQSSKSWALNAKNDALSAAASASAAATSESNAANSEDKAQAWAESDESPDGETDTDSPTGDTMSSKEWALYAKQLAQQIGNPVVSVTESNGTVTVAKSDGAQNTFGVVKSVNGVTPTGGNVDITGVPTGTILPFAGNTIPEGFLACNGAGISASTYSALYSVIGNTFGGDSTTFNLPNAESDKFLQGNSTPGTVKAPGLPNITGTIVPGAYNGWGNLGTGAFYSLGGGNHAPSGDSNGIKYGFDASRSNSIYGNAETVQPPALTVRFIIKY